MKRAKIEICCGSAEDVINAHKAGADRAELNSSLFQGGLTPTVGALRLAKAHADIPVMCMVRPREGGFCYTEYEFETMLQDAAVLLENGADGIVFGFLQADGTLDKARCQKMLDVIGDKTAVFHRAIDVTPDWRPALDALIEMGVARVLTSGQKPSVLAGAATIREMIGRAAGRIEILPGGDILPETASAMLNATGADQFHLMLSAPRRDTSCNTNTAIHFGGALYPPEDVFLVSDEQAIADLRGNLE